MALTALRRRHFEAPLAPPSTAAGQAELRVNLHAVVDARICAAFGTELALEPGRCDSMSVNRQDSSNRSYTPQDGNVEVITLCFVVSLFSPSPFLPQFTSVCANYLLGNPPPDMIPNLKM